jgi:hypothetical protein
MPAVNIDTTSFARDIRPSVKSSASRSDTGRRIMKTCGKQKTDALIDKCRNVVANIENEPDRDKARDAVQINLQEIAEDVAIEESHGLD